MADAPRRIRADEWIDALSEERAGEMLLRCCHSRRWVSGMLAARPFGSLETLRNTANAVWSRLGREDYLEAFAGHPPIGGDLSALRAKFAPTLGWSSDEQSSVAHAADEVLAALAEANRVYRERFGFVFIICATGKTAEEMLGALRTRLASDPAKELLQAASEQAKITELRLEKLAP